jgi:hypothetical protein
MKKQNKTNNNLMIRWLGAFRHHSSNLNQSMIYELNRSLSDEVAAEIIGNDGSKIHKAKVGLLLSREAVKKTFNGDCWSEYVEETGKLHKTRNPRSANSDHREAWVLPQYVGIVVRGSDMPRRITRTLKWVSKEYNLPIYRLNKKGELKEIPM